MGTKVNSNYEDLINFVRASSTNNTGAMALRPVSYGNELVDVANTASSWTAYGTNTIAQNGDAVEITYVNSGNGAYEFLTETHGLSQDLEAGKIYQITAEVKVNQGNVYLELRHASSTYESVLISTTDYQKVIFNIVVTDVDSVFLKQTGMGTGEVFSIKNISVKEVLFDQPNGTLTLFPHPENVPRVEYDADGNRLGLLVEEQRINEFTYSEAFNESNWQRPNDSYAASTLPFTEQSPTKVANSAATLIDNSSGGVGGVYIRSLANGLATSTPHTFSVFAKKDQLSYLALETKFFSVPTATVYFDLDAGTVGTATNCTGAIQEYPDGWYRCSLTFTTDASDGSGYGNIFVAEGDGDKTVDRDGTSSIFIFGAQFEEGSFPTSYIKNQGTSGGVTRSADLARIPVADFGYNQSKGTVLVEAKATGDDSSFPRFVSFQDDPSNRWEIIGDTALDVRFFSRFNAVTDVNGDLITDVLNGKTSLKVAYAKAENDAAGVANGGSVLTDTNNGQFSQVVYLYIGAGSGGTSDLLNGHIKSIKYYPRRLTNAQLQALTEPRSTPTLSLTFDGQESSYKENYIHG